MVYGLIRYLRYKRAFDPYFWSDCIYKYNDKTKGEIMCEICKPETKRACIKCKNEYTLTCSNFVKNGKYFRYECKLCKTNTSKQYYFDPTKQTIIKNNSLSRKERLNNLKTANPEKYKQLLSRANELNKQKPINQRIHKNLKYRAKKHNIFFDLKPEDIIVPEYCSVFPHIKLNFNNDIVSDDSPSGDRIDNSKGYIKGNVIVISNKANKMKNNGTLQECVMLGEFYKQFIPT